MKPGPRGDVSPSLRAIATCAALLSLSSCGLESRTRLLPNQPPEVSLDRPHFLRAIDGSERFGLSWKGRDPDGSVAHYLFTHDAALVGRVGPGWIKTTDVSTTVQIRRRAQVGRMAIGENGNEPRVFGVRAVDDRGAVSAPATIAFFGSNIAPEVTIVDPVNNFYQPSAYIGTSLQITWKGSDADGRIVKYKFKLFSEQNPDAPSIPNFTTWARANPDSFTRMYAPSFFGWDSVGSDVESTRYTGLTLSRQYLFAITAFDDAGGYAPLFVEVNMLALYTTSDDAIHPSVSLSSPVAISVGLGRAELDLHVEVPAEEKIPVSWYGDPPTGSAIDAYCWVLDPLDAADEKQRTHPTGDTRHWTPWDLANTSVTLGPFHSRRDVRNEHVLHIQARDIFDRRSTLRVHFTVVPATRERELLVVDDTRLTPDQLRPDGLLLPRGSWPSAAELDTFLYAQGGHPWRGYPPGSVSTRGLLAGYDFDTLGTRGLPDGIVPLSVLSRYRQIIWLTDDNGSTFVGSPLDFLQPITSLRNMNTPGRVNTLSTYVAQGGKLWLSGGGAAYATMAAWNRRGTPPAEFTHADGELVEGRFMYDYSHWRSGLALGYPSFILLHDAALWRDLGLEGSTASPGRGWPGQPNYGKLRTTLPFLWPRSLSTDPTPPGRRPPDQFFYFDYFTAEYLFQPNVILEDADPRPNHERLESALDTIYVAGGVSAQFAPVMTYYHGSEGGSVVFSGFPIWHFQRSQCATLVDFVLQDIWGLAKKSTLVAAGRR